MLKKIEFSVVLNFIVLLIFIVLVTFIGFKYFAQIYQLISEPEQFKNLLLSYGQANVLIFIFFQVLQVVVATIPGEFVQVAGGYIYGTIAGTFYSALGIMLGYFLVFFISRAIGYPLVKVFVSKDKIEKIKNLIQTKRSDALLFLLFFIPGIPKDFLVYAAGLTPIESGKFFIIVALARFPALFGASFIGANIEQQNYLAVAITFGISIVLFIAGFLLKDRFLSAVERRYVHKEKIKGKKP
jgi:uncharacterized membrane protein YdjX (TVP38/TMEM64 family)